MHLVRFKHHQLLLFELYHHGDVVKVTISEESLDLCSKVLGIEEENIASICYLQKFPLSESVLVIIDELVHSL